jgi:hypothetical protein
VVGGQHDGARENLALRLTELYDTAGRPLLDAVAKAAMARRPQAARWRVTGKRISAWKHGENVPESYEAFAAALRSLIERARGLTPVGDFTPGLYDDQQWLRWWQAARAEPPATALGGVDAAQCFARPIGELDPIDLEVHAAIDAGRSKATVGELPAYIHRPHDDWLRQIVANAARGRSSIAVLVGASSTGKTRACWPLRAPHAALQVIRSGTGPEPVDQRDRVWPQWCAVLADQEVAAW